MQAVFVSVPCWGCFGWDGGGGEDYGFLVFVLHFRVEGAKAGVLIRSIDNLTENVVSTDGEAGRRGLGGQGVSGALLKGGFVGDGEGFHLESFGELDADGILGHAGKFEIDGNIAFLVGEGGLCVGYEDIAGKEHTFAGR